MDGKNPGIQVITVLVIFLLTVIHFTAFEAFPGDVTMIENSPIEISTPEELQAMNEDLSADYVLVNDIDASVTREWNDGAGFIPIGGIKNRFTGSFDGRDHTIVGMYINRPETEYVGLFGYMDRGGTVRNLGLVDMYVTGYSFVGGLVGVTGRSCHINNTHTTGVTTSTGNIVGGMVGWNSGAISDSFFRGRVTGRYYVGGLVGSNTGRICKTYASVCIRGEDVGGGLVGMNNFGTVNNSYSVGTVTRVRGSQEVSFGGFVGSDYLGKIMNSYSTVAVYYEGADGPTDKGFCGTTTPGIHYVMSGNFWDVEKSGQVSTAGYAAGKTTDEMTYKNTFSDVGWDFDDTWNIDIKRNNGYPYLHWQELDEQGVSNTWIGLLMATVIAGGVGFILLRRRRGEGY